MNGKKTYCLSWQSSQYCIKRCIHLICAAFEEPATATNEKGITYQIALKYEWLVAIKYFAGSNFLQFTDRRIIYVYLPVKTALSLLSDELFDVTQQQM